MPTFRFRFLPAILIAASLMLSVKIGSIWNGVDALFDGSGVTATARAETSTPPKPAGEQPTPAPLPAGIEPVAEAPVAEGQQENKLSEAEITLLQQLAGRRDALDERARAAEKQEALLKAAEARIDQKVRELKSMQANLERLIKVYDEQHEAKILSLVKIYENMKPKDSARIFEELDMETLLPVAERMKERKLAPVMAEMNPTKAKHITEELSRLRQVTPATGPVPGPSGRS